MFCLQSNAQVNLVLNPSFEDTLSMTDGYPYLITANWWNPNGSTADYFSPYADELCCGSGLTLNAPSSELGFQLAFDGNAYIGLDIYELPENNTKEYAQGFLSSPLLLGESYCVELWVNSADVTGLQSCDLQVGFTSDLIYQPQNGGSLNLTNVVNFDISQIDSLNWTHFSAIYQAQGGEQFVYIGSNTPNDQLDCVEEIDPFSIIWNAAYIFVDSLVVKSSSNCDFVSEAGSIILANDFAIFPNPFCDFVNIQLSNADQFEYAVYDILGKFQFGNAINGGKSQLDFSALQDGIYILILLHKNAREIFKICKE